MSRLVTFNFACRELLSLCVSNSKELREQSTGHATYSGLLPGPGLALNSDSYVVELQSGVPPRSNESTPWPHGRIFNCLLVNPVRHWSGPISNYEMGSSTSCLPASVDR